MHKQVLAFAFVLSAGTAVGGDVDVSGLASTCFSCHGVNGVSVGETMPSIAGQNEEYLKRVMLEQKRDTRYSSIMGRLLKSYSEDEIASLAGYFSGLPWVGAGVEPELRTANEGRQLMQKTCQRCHGPTGNKTTDSMPRLTGQWPGYLALETMKYTDPAFLRKPSERMAERTCTLSNDDIKSIAHFLGTRK